MIAYRIRQRSDQPIVYHPAWIDHAGRAVWRPERAAIFDTHVEALIWLAQRGSDPGAYYVEQIVGETVPGEEVAVP